MSRLVQTIFVCLIIGVLGAVASPVFNEFGWEEEAGLDLLFRLRGPCKPPSDVVIVSIDKASAENFNLPNDPEKWPRSYHTRLIEILSKQGAAAIVFDMIFEEQRNMDDDKDLAKAISNAGNVVLCQGLIEKDELSIDSKGNIILDEPKPLIPFLEESALVLAPFPLPKIPAKLRRYWIFKREAGNIPTLPVVVFQVFAFEVYDEFIQLLKEYSTVKDEKLFLDRETIKSGKQVTQNIMALRKYFRENKSIEKNMTGAVKNSNHLSSDPKQKQLLISLIELYHGPKDHYLNFYGPPGTINSIPYYQILQLDEESDEKKDGFDLNGKAVFVGLSDNLRPNEKDGFTTVFTTSDGIDISGVEVAATVFGNLLENKPVRKILTLHYAIIFLWGALIGIICLYNTPVITAISLISLATAYLIFAFYQFKTASIWYPITVPLFFQGPTAYFSCILWKFFKLNKERQNIRNAFKYYLPEQVVEKLAINIGNIKADTQIVYGTCLFSDGEQYTSLSENMDPIELRTFMNSYYESVFEPIKQYGGVVSDVIGDSMLSIWATAQPDTSIRKKACAAAIDISNAVEKFKRNARTTHLPTRIGLHSGYISIGNIGAIDHYEYRPVGDIVNTASRIENLNKFLGTRILISKDVIHLIDDFLVRKVGEFLFKGKSKTVVIYELVSHKESSSEQQRELCRVFEEGLNAYYLKAWDDAINALRESLKTYYHDGPSNYYLAKCNQYKFNPPGENWTGIIELDHK